MRNFHPIVLVYFITILTLICIGCEFDANFINWYYGNLSIVMDDLSSVYGHMAYWGAS